jgi:hypothetical protein
MNIKNQAQMFENMSDEQISNYLKMAGKAMS